MTDGSYLIKDIYSIECQECKDIIWSRHRHDFNKCKCGACSVDGGRSYFKIGWLPDKLKPVTKLVDIIVNVKEKSEIITNIREGK